MEIEKDELESFLKEQMENVFAYAVLTKEGMCSGQALLATVL
jgi:hypothetical protein